MYLIAQLQRNKFVLSVIIALVFAIALAPAVFAENEDEDEVPNDNQNNLGFDPDTDTFGLSDLSSNTKLGKQNLQVTVAKLINVALGRLGIIAVVIILAGGFKWMTAGGNEDKAAEARKMIISGVIGLAIILSAFAIARFVFNALDVATGFQGGLGNLNDDVIPQ